MRFSVSSNPAFLTTIKNMVMIWKYRSLDALSYLCWHQILMTLYTNKVVQSKLNTITWYYILNIWRNLAQRSNLTFHHGRSAGSCVNSDTTFCTICTHLSSCIIFNHYKSIILIKILTKITHCQLYHRDIKVFKSSIIRNLI